MSGIKKVSPLLDEFSLGKAFSERFGVVCYPAIHSVTNEKFILKHISVPESQTKVDALILTGACQDRAAAQTYYEELAQNMVKEIQVLKNLYQTRGFASFYDYQLTPKENNQIGMDLWLLSPYRNTLANHMKRGAMTHLEAVNLGIDLCAALTLCRKAGYIYQNLRPENIFMTPQRKFQLGDLGLLALDEMSYAMVPDRYRSEYTPPELADPLAEPNATMDIYALGMVLFQVYNEGVLPVLREGDETPVHADKEMTEIIRKAVAPKMEDRWQNPEDMGQALVAYMQRNPVNDSLIVPAPEPEEVKEEPEKKEPEEEAKAEMPSEEPSEEEKPEEVKEESQEEKEETEEKPEEEPAVVPLILPAQQDKTQEPGEVDFTPEPDLGFTPTEPELPENGVKGEIQVPEGIGHPAQAPVQDEEMEDILSRADTFLEKPEETHQTEETKETSQEENHPASTEKSPEAEENYAPEEVEKEEEERKVSVKGFVIALAVIAGLAVAFLSGYFFYQHIYCVPVQSFQVVGSTLDTLTVQVTAEAGDEAFVLSCKDTFGNAYEAELKDGEATFTGLQPNTQYLVTLDVQGFHRLVGSNTVTYTTAIQTEITAFSAVTGSEDGSAVLTFTTNGTEPEKWVVTYSVQDEEEKKISFTGHNTVVSGLTVGKEYTFTLSAEVTDDQQQENEISISGNSSLTHVAMPVITAQNLMVSQYAEGSLTLKWDEPQEPVPGWSVRYYSAEDNENVKTLETDTCTVQVDGLDVTKAYTFEVTAKNMTKSASLAVSANPVVVKNVNFDTQVPGKVTISWEFDGKDPENWLLTYSFGDAPNASVAVQTQETTITVDSIIPKANYTFQIQPADGSSAFGGTVTLSTEEAAQLDAFGITAADTALALFPAPEDENWGAGDVDLESQTDTFKKDQSLAFMMEITGRYTYTDEDVHTLIVVRNSDGQPLDFTYTTAPWHTMWTNDKYVGELQRMPGDPGEYTLEIYFNGQLARSAAFTVTE